MTISLETRFWKKVDARGPGECWLWLGAVTTSGYGVLQRGGRGEGLIRAHRLSFQIHNGPIRFLVLHSCNTKLCVNPGHLFEGDYSTNLQQAWDDGVRTSPGRRIGDAMAKLSPEDVREIRGRRETGETLVRIARDYGVTMSCISNVARRNTWGHIE